MLSWFLDDVNDNMDEKKLKHIAFHILTMDFGVYTTSIVREPAGVLCLISTNDGNQSFTQALYHLALRPECIQPLRKEIENSYHEL